jgi:hypothetical protein
MGLVLNVERGGGEILSSGITSAGGFAGNAVSRAFLSAYLLFTAGLPFYSAERKNKPEKEQNERITRVGMPRN